MLRASFRLAGGEADGPIRRETLTAAHAARMMLRELAQALDLPSHGRLGDLESGRRPPSLDLAREIVDFFGVTVDQPVRDEVKLDDM